LVKDKLKERISIKRRIWTLGAALDDYPYRMSGKNLASRRTDRFIACVLLLVTLPLMVFAAIAIKCDSRGPVLVREERRDPRGRRFFALKFRSTVHTSADLEVVTFVGSIIRFLRIDNLPQLVNALRGEMTCVADDPDYLFFLD
jgi:lipopolysaccharide/colanic/teichoic acid biosynthesis glycosyltransferase